MGYFLKLYRFQTWQWARRHWRGIILAIFGFAWLLAYAYLPAVTASDPSLARFNSPDETANYYFSHMLATSGELKTFEPMNDIMGMRIHPRSVRVAAGSLVPGSFLGMILLYGGTGHLLGAWIIPFLTPVFAVLGVLAFAGFVRHIFGRNVALVSGLLLFAHPALTYYANRSMMHNVLFVSLLFGALWMLAVSLERKKLWPYLITGLFLGAALAVRTAEIGWVAAGLGVFLLLQWKKIRWPYLAVTGIMAASVFLPVLSYNGILYGHALLTGYDSIPTDELLSQPFSSLDRAKELTKLLFFPFGRLYGQAFSHFGDYFVRLQWWYFAPVAAGLLVFATGLFKSFDRRKLAYLAMALVSSFILIVYYGSWNFQDTLGPGDVTIGTSYFRYWLPIYAFSIPFAALALLSVTRLMRKKWTAVLLISAFTATITAMSVQLAFFSTPESLVSVARSVSTYQEVREAVLARTEDRAVIITDKSDKVFFPDRRVIIPMEQTPDFLRSLELLTRYVPVYYYTLLDDELARSLNAEHLGEYGLALELPGEEIVRHERLYRVTRQQVAGAHAQE